jgi:chorismate lyase/3-hydroxybenzoate synthase
MPDPGTLTLRGAFARESEQVPGDALAAIVFGSVTPVPDDLRAVRVNLTPICGAAQPVEVWRGSGTVQFGRTGPILHADDGTHLAAWMELDESKHRDLVDTAEAAYRAVLAIHAGSRFRHIWRMWNFVSGINEGDGDNERYKLFCLGRSRAFAAAPGRWANLGYPAATAVGKPDGSRTVQVCWFASTQAGSVVENPRQVPAYHYPRRYGPAAPSFSRALITPDSRLFVSGTASIVGHESVHAGDAGAQLAESLRNVDAILQHAGSRLPPRRPPPMIKVYVRPGVEHEPIGRSVREHFGPGCQVLTLDADICRAELLLEIEGVF